MKQLTAILFPLFAFAALAPAQFTPPATDRAAVTVNAADVLTAPTAAEFLAANPTFTGDAEWNTTAKINAATTDQNFLVESDVKYPVFVLTPPSGYTDFELKATRTNFGADGSPDLVYYYHSPGVSGSEIGTEPDVWHTDSGRPDVREWRKLPAATSIAANLSDANAVPGGIIVVVTDSAVADSANDPELVWSIVWFDAANPQTDAAGRQIWRAVTPTRYIGQTFTP